MKPNRRAVLFLSLLLFACGRARAGTELDEAKITIQPDGSLQFLRPVTFLDVTTYRKPLVGPVASPFQRDAGVISPVTGTDAVSIPAVLKGKDLPAVVVSSAVASTASGTLAAGTYCYKVTPMDAVYADGLISNEACATLSAPGHVTLTWVPSAYFATGYTLYRGASAGAENVANYAFDGPGNGGVSSYSDDGGGTWGSVSPVPTYPGAAFYEGGVFDWANGLVIQHATVGRLDIQAGGGVAAEIQGGGIHATGSVAADGTITASNFAGIQTCGTTVACANTTVAGRIIFGTVALTSGVPSTATVTGISPAYASSSSYVCVATQATSATGNLLKIVNVTGASFTITGPASVSDVVGYQCVGN